MVQNRSLSVKHLTNVKHSSSFAQNVVIFTKVLVLTTLL